MMPVAMKSAVIFCCVLALVSVANSLKHKTGKGICVMFKISSEHCSKSTVFLRFLIHTFYIFSPLGHGGRKSVVVANPVQSELRYP